MSTRTRLFINLFYQKLVASGKSAQAIKDSFAGYLQAQFDANHLTLEEFNRLVALYEVTL